MLNLTCDPAVVSKTLADLKPFLFKEAANTDYRRYRWHKDGDGVLGVSASDGYMLVSRLIDGDMENTIAVTDESLFTYQPNWTWKSGYDVAIQRINAGLQPGFFLPVKDILHLTSCRRPKFATGHLKSMRFVVPEDNRVYFEIKDGALHVKFREKTFSFAGYRDTPDGKACLQWYYVRKLLKLVGDAPVSMQFNKDQNDGVAFKSGNTTAYILPVYQRM